MSDDLCGDCPPVGYPTDKTRCAQCPRRTTEGPKGIVINMADMPELPPEAFDPIKDAMIDGLIKGGTEWRNRALAAEASVTTLTAALASERENADRLAAFAKRAAALCYEDFDARRKVLAAHAKHRQQEDGE